MEKSTESTKEILEAEKNYTLKITNKFADSNTAPKMYRTISNHVLYNGKIPTIPPLLVNDKNVSGFWEKANIFNNYFASICTPIDNANCLPSSSYRAGRKSNSVHVTENDILAIIKTLDPIWLMIAIIYLSK